MAEQIMSKDTINIFSAECEKCFGLCCVALPYAKSVDFAFDKEGGVPCRNLESDYRCGIHNNLRTKGFRGCTVYECFGAGQKVSQFTYKGIEWRNNPELAKEMFVVFPIMQQLYEMLRYLHEALSRKEARPIKEELKKAFDHTLGLTNLGATSILSLDIPSHRAKVNGLLLKTSELIRKNIKKGKTINMRCDLIGAKLKGANLRGLNLRGAFLIASDLRGADLRYTDLIGADLRDADLRDANLIGSIFLTQVQIYSAKGNKHTKLPPSLKMPEHWLR